MQRIILIIISIIIGISILGLIVFGNNEAEKFQNDEITIEILEEDIRIQNKEKYKRMIETGKYEIREREWQTSGPFSFDRYEYALGEKIFVNVEGLQFSDKGEMVFFRPINDTHYKIWKKYPFDGTIKDAFNVFFNPSLLKPQLICDTNDLLGDWRVEFTNTNYNPINFKIFNVTVTGDEKYFVPVC